MTFSVGFAAFAKAHKRNSSILNFNAIWENDSNDKSGREAKIQRTRENMDVGQTIFMYDTAAVAAAAVISSFSPFDAEINKRHTKKTHTHSSPALSNENIQSKLLQ